MLNLLKEHGMKLVTVIDPHTKVDDDYWIYKETKERNLNVKRGLDSSEDFHSYCFPGESVWFDYMN